jgi:hypothetical protein
MKNIKTFAAMATLLACASVTAAPINGSGNVFPDVIFGSGNANGSFTGINSGSLELGLRGKLRYNTSSRPENKFNYDGNKTYTFSPADATAPLSRSIFNFEWSINTDVDGNSNDFLNSLTYLLEIDFDPSAGTDFASAFDPINLAYADHSIGNNLTLNDQGIEAAKDDKVGYANLINTNNVAQQSWNLGFFEPVGFDPQTQGMYTINLSAFMNGEIAGFTSIDVIVGDIPTAVSAPAALFLVFGSFAGLGLVARRRRNS